MAELKNLRPFLQYWDQVANSYDEQVDVYSKLTGAIIHDWVYDYTKDGDLSVLMVIWIGLLIHQQPMSKN